MTVDEAVKHFGNKAGIARALDITPAAVYQWGDKVPELRAYQLRQKIEALTEIAKPDSSTQAA